MPLTTERDLPNQIAGFVPLLLKDGLRLSRDVELAKDLAQDTVLRALSRIDQFDPSTNLRNWLRTILRNLFLDHLRKRKWEVEDPDMGYADSVAVSGGQEETCDLRRALEALERQPEHRREAFELVVICGMNYSEAADRMGVPAGTAKSRVSLARQPIKEGAAA
jgi:RNA polymerase sigma-70 factor, ECF subfamily